ncbi:hypothetical protein LPJ64_001300 [Coemansia asiatica]|uniref:PH domain-containing protein n=1 Tax=Coemansia asiatica TaxID=1052880 RepID=A0A9W7XLK8_9FUNG|nr:hypothetical protein LPJ64_001300 [Coemansia asiatica]
MSTIPATAAVASVTAAASSFDVFRQKLYIRGVLGKKNDRAPDGRPYTMRKWTRWYVELRGPVLVFWNLLDTQLAAYLEDITAIVDGRVLPGSAEFERTVGHIKNIVLKPSFINITDAACAIVGKLKKRDSVWTLHSSGANRFYMQAVDDRAMNEWVRAIRLSCFEAAKLYEYYTSALVNERYSSTLVSQRPSEYHVHVRFSGTNDWVPCTMAISSNPCQIVFRSEETQAQVATIKSTRYAYSIYPDSLDKIDSAMIAKFEGDCDVDASLQPKLEAVDSDRDLAPLNPRDHGSYALVIFQSPTDMALALVEVASQSRLCNMPTGFVPEFVPDRLNLYLSLSDIADKSIEIMEPVTARRMLENLASERCPKAGSVSSDQAAGYWTSTSTANADSTNGQQQTQLPWMSDSEGEGEGENDRPINGNGNGNGNGNRKRDSFVKISKKGIEADSEAMAAAEAEDASADIESHKKKKAFAFLHKSSKNKDGSKRDSTIQPKDASSSNGSITSKHLKRQSKNSTNTTATTAASSNKDSFRSSGAESVSHVSTPPSLPTPVTASAAHGTFGDEASEAIVNLKIIDSPPAVNSSNGARFGGQAQNNDPVMRLVDDSEDDSESDAPLGSIVSRLAQNMGDANGANMMQQTQQQLLQQQQQMQMQMQMQRASTVVPGMGGPAQMMGMQQPNMITHTQSMYGATPNTNTATMVQMFPQQQQQQMFTQDPNQMMISGGMPMPYQNSPSVRGSRPNTYMDPAGGAWGQQLGAMGMNMGMNMGMGMDSVGGPLLTVEKKIDPIERPTGLVGAIATREQMKSEQKYRDSSSLMKERQMRRNQAMGMNNAIYTQQPGARFGGGGQGFPSMYGAPQGWNDDTMSMMSGMSGRAPYAQIAPSLSAEQLSGPYMRSTMYGGVPQPGLQMAGGAMANDEDDIALSVYAGGVGAGGNRLSMAAPDVHPLRAAMQSGMSASSPHLATSMNPYNHHQQQQLQLQLLQQQQQIQQLQLQQLQQQHQQPSNAFGDQQQRRMSVAGAPPAPISNGRNGLAHTISAGTSLSYNQLNSRHSVVSSSSGSGSSGNGSLAIQPRASANRWIKESSNLRVESGVRGGKDSAKASTMPRPRGPSSSGTRNNITSVYELPGRSSAVRIAEPAKPSVRASAYDTQYSSDEDDDDSEGGGNLGYSSSRKVSKELKQFFNVFADKCLDVKPYAWVDFSAAFDAYKSFCNRNGLRGTEVATSSQFQDLMEAAEWQLKTRESGVRAYYNTCLI